VKYLVRRPNGHVREKRTTDHARNPRAQKIRGEQHQRSLPEQSGHLCEASPFANVIAHRAGWSVIGPPTRQPSNSHTDGEGGQHVPDQMREQIIHRSIPYLSNWNAN
jgi:hypothetical protein